MGYRGRTHPVGVCLIIPLDHPIGRAAVPKTLYLKAQDQAVIYRRNFSSLTTHIHFDAVAVDGGQPRGEVTVQGSNWIFPKPAVTRPVQPHNTVQAGFWDTFFSIHVTAYTDLEIRLPQGRISFSLWWLGAIAVIPIAAALIFLLAQ